MRYIIAVLMLISVLAPCVAVGAKDLMVFAGDDTIQEAISQADQAYGLELSPMEKKVVIQCMKRDCPYMKNPRVKQKVNELMDKYVEYQLASGNDKTRLEQEMVGIGAELRNIMPRLKKKLAQDIVKKARQLTPAERNQLKERYPKAAQAIENAKSAQVTRRINVYEISDPASGTSDEFTFITLEVPEGGTLMEIVPKSVAADASLISSEQEFTVVQADPIIEWDIQAGSEITYSVPGDKSASVTDGPAIIYDKGDGTLLIIGAVLAVIIIGAIIVFAGGAAFLAHKKAEKKPAKKEK